MNKGAILASMAVIMLASVLAGAGTMAYFSSTETVGITFKAGTPNLRLSKDYGGSWGDSLSVSFPVWAPGDSYALEIWVKNIGDIGLFNLFVSGNNLVGPNKGLAEWIHITKIGYTDYHTGGSKFWVYPAGDGVTYYTTKFGNKAGYLRLDELASGVDNDEYMKFCKGDCATQGDYLPAGGALIQGFRMNFTFYEDAGNEWQGKSCGFDLVFIGSDEPFTPVWVPPS